MTREEEESQTLTDIATFNRGKSLFELEHQLETARFMFYDAVLDPTVDREMQTKYLNAYKLASDMYYARKWVKGNDR